MASAFYGDDAAIPEDGERLTVRARDDPDCVLWHKMDHRIHVSGFRGQPYFRKPKAETHDVLRRLSATESTPDYAGTWQPLVSETQLLIRPAGGSSMSGYGDHSGEVVASAAGLPTGAVPTFFQVEPSSSY